MPFSPKPNPTIYAPCINPNSTIFEAMGEFVYHFAGFENFLRMLLIDAVTADLQAGYFLISRLDASALPSKIRAALRHRKMGSDECNSLLTSLKPLTDFRNIVAHQSPELDDDFKSVTYHGYGDTAHGDAPSRRYETSYFRHATFFVMCASMDILAARDALAAGGKATIEGRTKAAFPQGLPSYASQPLPSVPRTPWPEPPSPHSAGWFRHPPDLSKEPYGR